VFLFFFHPSLFGRGPGIGLTANGLKHRFIPQYFERDISSGVPILTAAGRKAVEEELNECSDAWPSSS
jgi:hypothetical protein